MEMLKEDLVIGSSGNISVKIDDHVIITPSSVHYAEMKPKDVLVIDMNGDVIEGDLNPSVEMPTHLEIYKQRDDAKAVIHSHGVYSTALAILGKSLPPILDEVVPKLGGEIRVTSYSLPGTKELAKKAAKAMEDRSAVLIANHGAVICGKTLKETLHLAILLERTCKIYILALECGKPTQLPEEVVEDEEDLWQMMRQY